MPRLTSDRPSASVAITRPSLTPTMTPHPVPQNRHGAFDHLSSISLPPARFCAVAGMSTPATAAAAAAAWALSSARRERVWSAMSFSPALRRRGSGSPLIDEGSGEHAGELSDMPHGLHD